MRNRFMVWTVLLMAVIMSLITVSSVIYALDSSDIKINAGSNASSLPQIGDTVKFSITAKNDSSEILSILSITEVNNSKIFDYVTFVEDSVEVNGVPVSYTYNSVNKTLRIALADIPAGEERVITFMGELSAEGSFTRSLRISTGTGSLRLWGTSETTVVHQKTCKVTYDANTGTGTVSDVNSPYLPGSTVTVLSGSSLYKENYIFAGWTLTQDGNGVIYESGDTIPVQDSDIVLYAKWDPVPVITEAPTPEQGAALTETPANEATVTPAGGDIVTSSPLIHPTVTATPSTTSGAGPDATTDHSNMNTGDNETDYMVLMIMAFLLMVSLLIIPKKRNSRSNH